MAQFVMQGSLKLLFNGEGVSSLLEHKDPFHYNFRSTQIRRQRRLLYIGSSGGIYYSSSSLSSKSNSCNAEARPSDCVYESDSDDDDFESDILACFRGLALDVSYRPFNVVGCKRAICLEFMEKADVLEYYDQTVNSTSGSFYIPAVLGFLIYFKLLKEGSSRAIFAGKIYYSRTITLARIALHMRI